MNHPYDNSQLQTFQTCPYKYRLNYLDGLERSGRENASVDLEFGSAVHKYLELYYKSLRDRTPLPCPETVWADYPIFPGEELKTKETGIALCKNYSTRYAEQDQDFEILYVEEPVRLKINGCEFLIKVDTIIKYRDNYYSFEHKTGKDISYRNFFEKFRNASQMTAQCAAVRELVGECSGVIINALGAKIYKRKYLDKHAGLHCLYERHIENRTNQEIDNWRMNAKNWIHLIEEAKESNKFLRADGNACWSFNRPCKYMNLCKTSAGYALDQDLIEQDYHVINPYEYMYD